MAHHLGRIFAAGIVWDPREPLPPEFEPQAGYNAPRQARFDLQDDLAHGPHGRFPWHGPGGTIGTAFTATTMAVTHTAGHLAQVPQPHVAPVPRPPSPIQSALPGFTVQEPTRNVLPPLSISLDASIVQDTARVTVTQTFWNDSSRMIKEAAYTFPLPTGCTVADFSCRIGAKKIIKGSVRPKEEAREAFLHHIRHHNTGAALLEQDTPEIFTTSLGNIPEKTKIKVNLSFITLLKHRFADSRGTTTLTIPTYIASRYGSPPSGAYKAADSSKVPQGLSLEIEIVESERVHSIASTSHKVEVDRRRGRRNAASFADLAGDGDSDGSNGIETALVKLESGATTFLDRDFVLDIVTERDADSEAPQAWLEEHPTLPNHKALMLTLPPRSLGQTENTRGPKTEILFLADRSGSMSDKISSLKSAMEFFLKGIPEGHRFNIWSFGTRYESWSPQSADYTEMSLNAALSYVDSAFKANMGGTEILPAVEAIVAARDKNLKTDVIILTDGQTWRMEQTLDFIQQTRMRTEGRVRFFSLGIGDAVSHALVEGIAKAGGGYAEVVPASIRDGWEDRVVSMLKAALTTDHLGPLHLQFESRGPDGNGAALDLADAQRSPADISTLTPFNHSRVYFLFDSTADPSQQTISGVTISAPSGGDGNLGGNRLITIPVATLSKKDTTIHKLAARSLLEDLERGRSHIHLGPHRQRAGTWAETSMVRREAEAIACKWSLVSKWTSFFLVEEPYVPKGDDPFMDGVIVPDAPGDDLLRPRGNAQAFAALESASTTDSLTTSDLDADSHEGPSSATSTSTSVERVGGVIPAAAVPPLPKGGSSEEDRRSALSLLGNNRVAWFSPSPELSVPLGSDYARSPPPPIDLSSVSGGGSGAERWAAMSYSAFRDDARRILSQQPAGLPATSGIPVARSSQISTCSARPVYRASMAYEVGAANSRSASLNLSTPMAPNNAPPPLAPSSAGILLSAPLGGEKSANLHAFRRVFQERGERGYEPASPQAAEAEPRSSGTHSASNPTTDAEAHSRHLTNSSLPTDMIDLDASLGPAEPPPPARGASQGYYTRGSASTELTSPGPQGADEGYRAPVSANSPTTETEAFPKQYKSAFEPIGMYSSSPGEPYYPPLETEPVALKPAGSHVQSTLPLQHPSAQAEPERRRTKGFEEQQSYGWSPASWGDEPGWEGEETQTPVATPPPESEETRLAATRESRVSALQKHFGQLAAEFEAVSRKLDRSEGNQMASQVSALQSQASVRSGWSGPSSTTAEGTAREPGDGSPELPPPAQSAHSSLSPWPSGSSTWSEGRYEAVAAEAAAAAEPAEWEPTKNKMHRGSRGGKKNRITGDAQKGNAAPMRLLNPTVPTYDPTAYATQTFNPMDYASISTKHYLGTVPPSLPGGGSGDAMQRDLERLEELHRAAREAPGPEAGTASVQANLLGTGSADTMLRDPAFLEEAHRVALMAQAQAQAQGAPPSSSAKPQAPTGPDILVRLELPETPASNQEPEVRVRDTLSPDPSPPEVLTAPASGPSAETQARLERDWVRRVLRYQTFNGSFNFFRDKWADWRVLPVLDDMEAVLGAPIAQTLRNQARDKRVPWDRRMFIWLCTAAVLFILRRDFQSCRALWGMMEVKAERYVDGFIKVNERMANMDLDGLLRGLHVPIDQQSASGDAAQGKGSEQSVGETETSMVDTAPRELVSSAPVGD